jgi:hypothetical protein
MAGTSYQRLATSAQAADEHEDEHELSRDNAYTRATLDEFNRPAPAWWKRALLIAAIFFLGYAAWKLGRMGGEKPKVIYATR